MQVIDLLKQARFLPADPHNKKSSNAVLTKLRGTSQWSTLCMDANKSGIWNALTYPEAMEATGAALAIMGDGIVCIDVDNNAGKDGNATFEQLRQKYNLPNTYFESTQSGGYHYYYTTDPNIKLKNDANGASIGRGVDVKHYHGLSMFAGSKVFDSQGNAKEYKRGEGTVYDIAQLPLDLQLALIDDEVLRPAKESTSEELDLFTRVLADHDIVKSSYGRALIVNPIHGSDRGPTGYNFAIDWDKGVWYCFKCRAGGGVENLIALLELKLDCKEAAKLSSTNRFVVHKIMKEKYGVSKVAEPTMVDLQTDEAHGYLLGEYYKDSSRAQLPTVIEELDNKFSGGFAAGDFYVISGDTGAGKSRVSASLIVNTLQRGVPCHIASLEMEPKELIYMVAAQVLDETYITMRLGKKGVDEMNTILAELRTANLPLSVSKHGVLNGSSDITSVLETLHNAAKRGVKLFIIDYLQVIQKSDMRADNGVAQKNKFEYIVEVLHETAKELGVCIIGLSQNNDKKKEKDKPSIFHISGSTAIGRRAVNIIMLVQQEQGLMELNVLKNRLGETGPVLCEIDWRTNTLRGLDGTYNTDNYSTNQTGGI